MIKPHSSERGFAWMLAVLIYTLVICASGFAIGYVLADLSLDPVLNRVSRTHEQSCDLMDGCP